MRQKAQYRNPNELKDFIAAARGQNTVDLVLKNVSYLDVFSGTFAIGDVAVHKDRIVGIGEEYSGKVSVDGTGKFLVPGFIDTHVHLESSMMTPTRFQEAVLPHGTTTAVWDPHEIANVKGLKGIEWALKSSEGLLIDIFVMVPSCVPSTSPELEFETSGASLVAADLAKLNHPRILGLAEMMNFPGLLFGDSDVMNKLQNFNQMRRDGHCPGLKGKDLNAYAVAGIHSCHESTAMNEAREKMRKGIRVLIREGSCAKDAQELLPLINAHTSSEVGLCSDDRNPLDIAHEGHIDFILNMALKRGMSPENVFRAASYGASRAYGLEDRGAVAPGYLADVVMIAQSTPGTWIDGMVIEHVYKSGKKVERFDLDQFEDKISANYFGKTKNLNLKPLTVEDFKISTKSSSAKGRVIVVRPRQIITDAEEVALEVKNGSVCANVEKDILKIAVFERHQGSGRSGVAFVRGFGIQKGAIATSINHDCHNVITVGSSDELMVKAVNELLKIDGGIVVVSADGKVESLALPIGGLMTSETPGFVAERLEVLKEMASAIGCKLEEPFLQLSFLALPVIPSLKITDRGLVDVTQFKKVSVLV